jgi:cytochrome c peroxidase
MNHRSCLIYLALLVSTGSLLAEEYELKVPLGLDAMRIPKDNPLTADKIELGKQLYFDKRLSRDNTVSCATCHDPEQGWSNGEAVATGIGGQKGGRSSPTIINSGYSYFQFWDGRAKHVEGQALGPIQNPIEMDLTLDELTEKLNKVEGYQEQFQQVFESEVTSEGIAKAIGAFERTILSGNSPYDQYQAGQKEALSEAAQRGMELFFNKAHCSACHAGANFSDGGFHSIGHGYDDEKQEFRDIGRHAISELGGDSGSFKTPTLREIARTAPYMHDGEFKTLKSVVEYYNRGGNPNDYLDEEIFPLKLTEQEIDDLVTFLKEGLSSEDYPLVKPPKLPE